jgi:hypothetical protein
LAYQQASQSSNPITANGDHFNRAIISPSLTFDDYKFPATHPSSNAFSHQTFPGQNDATVTGGYNSVPIYAWNNQPFQYHNALTANGRQINDAFSSPSLNFAYQQASQSSNPMTANGDHFNPTIVSPLNFDDSAFLSSCVFAEYDGQFGAALQLPIFSGNNDFGGSDGFDNSTPNSTTASELNSSANTDTQTIATNFAQLPVRTINIATAATRTNVNTNRIACDQPGCTTTFARARDLSRHRKQHGTPEHPCLVNNCDRKGDKAFYRLDKLRVHQQKKHRMAVYPEGE